MLAKENAQFYTDFNDNKAINWLSKLMSLFNHSGQTFPSVIRQQTIFGVVQLIQWINNFIVQLSTPPCYFWQIFRVIRISKSVMNITEYVSMLSVYYLLC